MYHMTANRKKTIVTDRISTAFLELLKEKTFADITVTELVKKAGVARASFYRNFDSTSDVMNYILDDFISRLLLISVPAIQSSDKRVWKDFLFQYIYFLKSSEKEYINIRLDNISILLNNFINSAREKRKSLYPKASKEIYKISGKLSLINGVLLAWKESGMEEPVEDIVDYLMSIISLF